MASQSIEHTGVSNVCGSCVNFEIPYSACSPLITNISDVVLRPIYRLLVLGRYDCGGDGGDWVSEMLFPQLAQVTGSLKLRYSIEARRKMLK